MRSKDMLKISAACLVLLGLAGCGGGGGGGGGNTAAPSVPVATPGGAQGVYEGTTSTGYNLNTIVLEDDSYFGLYGKVVNGVLGIVGFVQGKGSAVSGSFSSTDLKDFAYTGSVTAGSLSASYVQAVSFNGSSTDGTQTLTFTGAKPTSGAYVYDAPANLANITGAWSMTDMFNAPSTLNIAASGAFTGSSNGCTFSGTLTPRASGKNVFNLALTFGAAPCKLANQSATGGAIEYVLATGKRQLIVVGTDAPRANGTVIFGTR